LGEKRMSMEKKIMRMEGTRLGPIGGKKLYHSPFEKISWRKGGGAN